MKNNHIVIPVLFLLTIFISCKSTDNLLIIDFASYEKYFETPVFPVKGVMVIAHGLNTKPSKMGDADIDGTLVKLFLDNGYHVYRIALPGHEGHIEEMQNIKAGGWLNSAFMQYHKAAEIARNNNVPVYLTAFSLGALVYNILINNEKDVEFKRAVLFAPALAIKGSARAGILAADFFLPDSAIIKSRAPIEYQAQKGVSICAYKALFELEDILYKNEFINCNIPSLIFIDPKDELISISKLRKVISNFNLSNWNIVTVSNEGAEIRPKYHHLIIDSKTVSHVTWDVIREKIVQFLID